MFCVSRKLLNYKSGDKKLLYLSYMKYYIRHNQRLNKMKKIVNKLMYNYSLTLNWARCLSIVQILQKE